MEGESCSPSNVSHSICFENPFSDGESLLTPVAVGSDEQFVGDDLKAFFDKEEKLYQSTSSAKSDYGEKSNIVSSGITMRSFMVDSGDSDLIQQKLTMSQYLAYRSEPLGQLGDSASFVERPYFSFQGDDKSPLPSETSEAPAAEFNPDFSQEPSWLNKKSLSLLSSSESLEIPSKSPDCSENWLLSKNLTGTNTSQPLSNAVDSISITSFQDQNKLESSKNAPEVSPDSSSSQSSVGKERENSTTQPETGTRKNDSVASMKSSMGHLSVSNALQPKSSSSGVFKSSLVSDCESSHGPENSVDESAAYKADEEEEDSPVVPSLHPHEPGEMSELPSCYWRPAEESKLDMGQSQLELGPGRLPSQCHSYVAGHVDSLPLGSNGIVVGASLRPSDIATATSQSSSSPASTVRENTDFARSDSLCVSVSEPQLSSTREITDDCIDLGLYVKRVHFNAEAQREENAKPNQLPFHDTLLDATPNLCSTARSYVVITPGQDKACTPVRNVRDAEPPKFATPTNGKAMDQADQECFNGQSIILPQDQTGFTPESWVAVFSNTSALSTPGLMNKIKDHVLRLHGRGMSVPPSESSGIGESGFEITDSSNHMSIRSSASLMQPPSGPVAHPSIPASVVKFASPNSMVQQIEPPATISTSTGRSQTNGRHTIATLPIHGSNSNVNGSENFRTQTPVNDAAQLDFKENGFARLTSTVMKKVPAEGSRPSVAGSKGNAMEKRPTLPSAPVIKCNRTHIYFGGAKVRQSQKQFLVIRNSSFTGGLDLELRVKDSEDFYIINSHQSLVSRQKLHLDPRQELSVELMFQPQSLGRLSTKLNLYPRCETAKKVKYTVDLSGYGGSSQIHVGPEQTLVPKSNGTFWKCQFVLENRGNIAGFVLIQPLHDDDTPMEGTQCIILPQCCLVNPGDFKEVQVLIHPAKDKKLTSFKMRLLWGDEPLRTRWMKCIANGAALKDENVDWTKLMQLECSTSPVKTDVGDEDMELFHANLRTENVSVIIRDVNQDSHFVTLLATESATVLEASSVAPGAGDTMNFQRRQTTASNCGNKSSTGCVSASITELVFPSTKVGSVSTQKIPLQNWSAADQEVRVKQISGPFRMVHDRSSVPRGYYSRLPIQFHPTTSGVQLGSVVLEASQQTELLVITLRGDAFCS